MKTFALSLIVIIEQHFLFLSHAGGGSIWNKSKSLRAAYSIRKACVCVEKTFVGEIICALEIWLCLVFAIRLVCLRCIHPRIPH